MAIFNSYVKLPEGTVYSINHQPSVKPALLQVDHHLLVSRGAAKPRDAGPSGRGFCEDFRESTTFTSENIHIYIQYVYIYNYIQYYIQYYIYSIIYTVQHYIQIYTVYIYILCIYTYRDTLYLGFLSCIFSSTNFWERFLGFAKNGVDMYIYII